MLLQWCYFSSFLITWSFIFQGRSGILYAAYMKFSDRELSHSLLTHRWYWYQKLYQELAAILNSKSLWSFRSSLQGKRRNFWGLLSPVKLYCKIVFCYQWAYHWLALDQLGLILSLWPFRIYSRYKLLCWVIDDKCSHQKRLKLHTQFQVKNR